MAWWKSAIIVLLVAGLGASLRAQPRRQAPPSVNRLRVSVAEIEKGKTFGVQTAPIKIDAFTDFECPACRALYLESLRPLINQYVSSGKVYLVHHDFPLPTHQYSRQAADYADAAAAIGCFDRVEDVLFTHQLEWAANGKIEPFLAAVLSPSQLKKVEELARTKEVQEAVQRDVSLGHQLAIRETPTMYITHKGQRMPIIGIVSYSILRRYLDALLRQ